MLNVVLGVASLLGGITLIKLNTRGGSEWVGARNWKTAEEENHQGGAWTARGKG